MAPELRKRKSKADLAAPAEEPTKVVAKKAAAKAPKTEKRKANEESSPIAKKKQKAVKGADVVASKVVEEVEEAEEPPKKSVSKKEKPAKKTKAAPAEKKTKKEKPVFVAEPEEQQEEEAAPSDKEEQDEAAEEEEEVDIQTQALVETLDDGEGDEDEKAQISTFKKGQDVGKAPKAKKASKAGHGTIAGQPGVMYLGSIPHGFYEHEIKSYFSQFGEITRLRVVRNKKTGASRHRAFLEFADAEVADIAARTMDSYLLFGHILRAKMVPPEDVHPELFKGSNRRFKPVPWNKMVGRHLERPLGESKWAGKITKEEQRRAARAEKLKAMDYEFEAPALKAAVAKELPTQLEGGDAEAVEAVEALEAPAPVAVEKKEEQVVGADKAGVPVAISKVTKKAKKGPKAKKVKA